MLSVALGLGQERLLACQRVVREAQEKALLVTQSTRAFLALFKQRGRAFARRGLDCLLSGSARCRCCHQVSCLSPPD